MRKSGYYKVILWGIERICFYSEISNKWRFACNDYVDSEFDLITDEKPGINRNVVFL